MRSLTSGERTILEGAHYRHFVRITVEDADGTYQDISDRSLTGDIAQSVDQIVPTGEFSFQRGGTGSPSLSPLDEDSTLNRNAAMSYAPLIQVGRGIRVDFATLATGTPSTEWKRVFTGRIDEWRVESEAVTVRCRDAIGATLADRWVEAETVYGTTSGQDIEDVMQAILDDWADSLSLYTPTSPSFAVTDYQQQKMSVLDALQALCALIGWVVEPRWDDGTSAFRLTFYEPDRTATSPQWSWTPSRYHAVPEFRLSVLGVRNALSGWYTDANGVRQQYTVEDANSIAQYGRQWMEIEEGDDSPINTQSEMQTMLDAAILDLADPIATQEKETFCFWPVQLGDYYGYAGNAVHYSEAQEFGVTGFRHLWDQPGHIDTRIRTRGKPAGFANPWLRRGGTVTAPTIGFKTAELSWVPDNQTFQPGNVTIPTQKLTLDWQVFPGGVGSFDWSAQSASYGPDTGTEDITGDGRTTLAVMGFVEQFPADESVTVTLTPYKYAGGAAYPENIAGETISRTIEGWGDTGMTGGRVETDYDSGTVYETDRLVFGKGLTIEETNEGRPRVRFHFSYGTADPGVLANYEFYAKVPA